MLVIHVSSSVLLEELASIVPDAEEVFIFSEQGTTCVWTNVCIHSSFFQPWCCGFCAEAECWSCCLCLINFKELNFCCKETGSVVRVHSTLILITELRTQNMILMNKTVHDKCHETFTGHIFATHISNSTETKFLGLITDETKSRNQHVDQIAIKLCSACYALRNLKYIVPQSTLRTICYAYIYIPF